MNMRDTHSLGQGLRQASDGPMAHLQEQFAQTRLPLADARQLPGEVYCSPAIYALEKERIFLRTWMCVAREEEIPNAGDFMTGTVAGESYVLSRDTQGNVAAFINKCLHRGVPVAEGKGNTQRFSCPYHAWLYDLQGNLLGAPHMQRSNADLKGWRLRPLHLARWRGWFFINFDEAPISFEEFIEPYDKEYWWFKSDECRLADVATIEVACNWKLLVENLIDMYHVPVIHKGSFGQFSRTPRDEIKCKLLPRGGWVLETEARPHAKGGRQLFPTLPWMKEKSSGVSLKGGIFPNLNISTRTDCLRVWALWPTSLDTTEIRLYTMYTPAAFEMPDFQQCHEEGREFLVRAIADEDGAMVTALQKSVSSPFYEPGPMCFLEDGIHHIMNYYLDVMAPMEDAPV